MTSFFTSDLHFDHDAIRIHCNRPWDTKEAMNEAIIQNWNEIVGPKDEVFIVGDFAWKRHAHFLGALKGKKHLIKGNHDRMPQVALRCFTSVTQILERKFGEHVVVMCHFPMLTWNRKHYGAWHLHGHCHGDNHHGRHYYRPGVLDVGVDANNFTPIPWEMIERKLE